MDPATYE
jgi:hypothetical protein